MTETMPLLLRYVGDRLSLSSTGAGRGFVRGELKATVKYHSNQETGRAFVTRRTQEFALALTWKLQLCLHLRFRTLSKPQITGAIP